MFHRS